MPTRPRLGASPLSPGSHTGRSTGGWTTPPTATDYREDFTIHEPLDGTDVGVNKDGQIAITPLMMPHAAEVTDEARNVLER